MSRVPSIDWRDGRAGHEFLFDWHSILNHFCLQSIFLVMVMVIVTLGHTWRCPSLLQCRGLPLHELPRDDALREPRWQALDNHLLLIIINISVEKMVVLKRGLVLLTNGMAKGNRTTVDIHPCRINAQLFHLWCGQYIVDYSGHALRLLMYLPQPGTVRQRPHWAPRVRLGRQSNLLLPKQLSLPGSDRCPSDRAQHLPWPCRQSEPTEWGSSEKLPLQTSPALPRLRRWFPRHCRQSPSLCRPWQRPASALQGSLSLCPVWGIRQLKRPVQAFLALALKLEQSQRQSGQIWSPRQPVAGCEQQIHLALPLRDSTSWPHSLQWSPCGWRGKRQWGRQ